MTELCLKCWKKHTTKNDIWHKYIMSNHLEICKECGKPKYVIVGECPYYWYKKFRFVILPFEIVYNVFYITYRLIELPFRIIIYWEDFKTFTKNYFKK